MYMSGKYLFEFKFYFNNEIKNTFFNRQNSVFSVLIKSSDLWNTQFHSEKGGFHFFVFLQSDIPFPFVLFYKKDTNYCFIISVSLRTIQNQSEIYNVQETYFPFGKIILSKDPKAVGMNPPTIYLHTSGPPLLLC